MAAPAMVRESGAIWLGLQVQHHFGDPARDLGAVLEKAIAQAEAGEVGIVGLTDPPGEGPRLQDLVTGDSLDVTVHEGFDFWLSDVDDKDAMAGALDQANEAAIPTSRLSSVEAAYWTSIGTKEHLRWVMPQPEDALLAALARLHVAGNDVLVPGARFVGMFRTHGVLAPVWDLEVGTGADREVLQSQRLAQKPQPVPVILQRLRLSGNLLEQYAAADFLIGNQTQVTGNLRRSTVVVLETGRQ